MIYVIGISNMSRHAVSMVGCESRSQDLLRDDKIIFPTFAIVGGSNDTS